MTPFVLTTTALFSPTSRSLRPLHRTTTVMFVSTLKSVSKSRSLRFMPAAGDALVDEAVSAREAAPDLSKRDVTVAALWGLTLGARVVDPARMLARPTAPGRDGGGMAAEDWAPLLRGAFRLESRVKACTSGDSGIG